METLEQKIHKLSPESRTYIEQVVQNLLNKQKTTVELESSRHGSVEESHPTNDFQESDHSSRVAKEPVINFKSTQHAFRHAMSIGSKEPNQVNIRISKSEMLSLPAELTELANEIERSRYMLQLHDSWDDEGAIKYEPATWVKAVMFISTYAQKVYEISGKVISTPSIYHGPKGSIDIYWDTEKYYLLINIPSGVDSTVRFYGNNRKHTHVEGTIDGVAEDKLNLGLIFILEDIQ